MADDRKSHVDALADVVFVFHLGLCERRAARDAPVNRFLAAIDEAFLNNVREQPQFVRFIFLV